MNNLISIFIKFLGILGKIIKKDIIYIYNIGELGNNAVLSKFGYWYVGNIYDYKDIAYGIANNGEIEEEGLFIKKLIETMLENNNIIFYDIGANTGYFGILSNFIGKGNLITHFFEPIKEHTNCIEKSIYLNKLEKTAFVHKIGLSDQNTNKTFYLAGTGSSLEKNFNGRNSKEQISIKIKKLDDYINEKNINKPDFLKIDVEGHEYNVLFGANKIISDNLPVIYIEIAKSIDNPGVSYKNDKFTKTIKYIQEKGYKIYSVIDNKKIKKFNFNDKINSGVIMYLCLHNNKHSKLIKKYENR